MNTPTTIAWDSAADNIAAFAAITLDLLRAHHVSDDVIRAKFAGVLHPADDLMEQRQIELMGYRPFPAALVKREVLRLLAIDN